MEITTETVDKLADLAKLEFDAEGKKEIIKDLNRIFTLIDKLNEVDTTGIEPLIYMNEDVNVLREDEVIHTLTQQEALMNAPKKDSDYIKVSKVLDK